MIIPHLTQSTSPHLSKTNTGLGNALFQIFSAYGLSKAYNNKLNLINLIELLVILKKMGLNHDETIYRNFKKYYINYNNINPIIVRENRNLYSSYDSSIIDSIKSNNNIYLIGYLQSHFYFDNYYSEICELIKPDENSYLIIKNKYPHLLNKNDINISCHFRINWGCKIKYDEKFTYFFDALNFILKKINKTINVNLNIFSDDIQNTKTNIETHIAKDIIEYCSSSNINFIFFEDNFDYIDLWCMSLCDHNILSNSTLSWWGAYLNQNPKKFVTYPDDILRLLGGTIYNEKKQLERRKEHYKENWISIKTNNVIYQ